MPAFPRGGPRPGPRRTRLAALPLEDRAVPAFLTGAELVVAADAGSPPLVRFVDPGTGTDQAQFFPFESTFYGGVRVAVGDVTGDGYPDLVAAAGPTGGPAIKVFDGASGGLVSSFYAFEASFTGGVFVAVGDTDGDGRDEIIAGAGGGGGSVVGVFDGRTGGQMAAFFAYSPEFLGGVRVAAGDTDGDGTAEIVTVPGYGAGPEIRIFDRAGGSVTQVGSFAGFAGTFTGGAFVAAGDTDGDGKAEVVVGAGVTGGPRIAVYEADGTEVVSFFSYADSFRGGVRVATADLTGDGTDEVLTVAGPTGGSQVNVYSVPGQFEPVSLFGFPSTQMTGFFIAGSGRPINVPSATPGEVQAAYDAFAAAFPNGEPIGPPPDAPTVIYNPFGFLPFVGFPFFFDAFGFFSPLGWYYPSTFFPGAALAPAVLESVYYPDYDPFAFSDPFVDPFVSPAGFADPGFGFVDPGFSFADPGFTYVDPGYSFVDPGFSYVDPGFYGGGFYDYGGGFADFGGGFFDSGFGGFF